MDELVIRLFVRIITLQKLIVRTLQAFSSEPGLDLAEDPFEAGTSPTRADGATSSKPSVLDLGELGSSSDVACFFPFVVSSSRRRRRWMAV